MAKVTGTAGVDTLNGTIGNDTINGMAGADTMIGGLGHDVYYVDNVLDVIVENSGEGTDKVYSTVSYTLDDTVEDLVLLGTADINAIGNNWDNVLTGNRGDNTLDGGAGKDTLIGGKGNDTYIVNIFSTNGINDKKGAGGVIIDTGGIDTVIGAGAGGPGLGELKYIMQKGLENATFNWTDTDCIVTGNASRNIIQTGDGDDTLYGLGGNDTLIGGAGDDTLDGGKGADTLNGGAGKNTYIIDNKGDVIIDAIDDTADEPNMDTAEVYANWAMNAGAHVEIVKLMGTKGLKVSGNENDNSITGNSGANSIHGGAGDDWIDGGGGKDKLWGGLGADTFYFSAGTAFDKKPVTIMDFNVADGDVLDISDILTNYDSDFTITDWLRITDKGKNSIVEVDADGGMGPLGFVQIATIYGVTGLTGETALLLSGNIIAEA